MKPITIPILIACGASRTKAGLYVDALNEMIPQYGINTPVRLPHFLSQILHESIGLTATVENLNYSAKALVETWPKRFATLDFAMKYARQPQKIANYVYANRLGNGPIESNDGWTFRGRGPIQATGKDKYIILSNLYHVDYVTHPEYLERPYDGMRAAFWYWKDNGINSVADTNNPTLVTKKINGGTIGLESRILLLARCKTALAPLFI